MKLTLVKMTARRAGLATLAVGLTLAFAGCKDKSEPAPATGSDYYPIAVGNYWVYAVNDTIYSPVGGSGANFTPSVATPTAYQFKETITEVFTDAAGQPAYRLVRSKLISPATTFRDDSVFVLSATPQFVALNRNNVRTLELIFPVRDGRSWNLNAFNNNFNDTITAETRQYSRVGKPFIIMDGMVAKTYSNTVTTTNTGAATENSLIKRLGYQQVFAKGVGPVFRRRFYFVNYNYPDATGNQVYPPGAYTSAVTRSETLISYGTR